MNENYGLATSLIEISPLLLRTVKAEIRLAAAGRITHPQYRILSNIQRGLNTVGEIANNQGVSQPAMSKMIESLVRKGWVLRSPKAKDRRQIHLSLSKRGQALYEDLKKKAARSLAEKIRNTPQIRASQVQRSLGELQTLLQQLQRLSEEVR